MTLSAHPRKFILLLPFILLAASCKKPGHVKGRVINVLDNKPLAGVPVLFETFKHGFWDKMEITEYSYYKAVKAESDSNGEFEMDYHARDGRRYHHRVRIDYNQATTLDSVPDVLKTYLLFSDNRSVAIQDMPVEGGNVELKIAPAIRVKVIGRNKNPVDSNDKLELAASINDFLFYSSKDPHAGDYHIKVPGDGDVPVKIMVTKNGVTTTSYDTIHAQPFGKVTYHVDY